MFSHSANTTSFDQEVCNRTVALIFEVNTKRFLLLYLIVHQTLLLSLLDLFEGILLFDLF